MYDIKFAVYRGITIVYNCGLYSSILDLSIESEFFSDITRLIDDYFSIPQFVPVVEPFIIGEYVYRSSVSNLLN